MFHAAEDNPDCRSVKQRITETANADRPRLPPVLFLLIDASIKNRSLPQCQKSEWNRCAAAR
jgi:hypothetical protein